MTKKNKIIVKLEFDSPQLSQSMHNFFTVYTDHLQNFIREDLAKLQIDSDPEIIVKDKEVVFKTINTNKGSVFVYSDDKQNNFKTIDYKLVPNDEAYLLLENGQMVIWFKRGGAPDDQIGSFPSLNHAIAGLKSIEDPVKVQQRIEELDARDKEKNDEIIAELQEKNPQMKVEK